MIRRAAYQEVVVVVATEAEAEVEFEHTLSPLSRPSPLTSSSPPPAYPQHAQQTQQQQRYYPTATSSLIRPWDNNSTNTSLEHNSNVNNTFKVPIHIIKRSRAVLLKDLERLLAPSSPGFPSDGLLQTIRTQRGDIIYSRHDSRLNPDRDHESSNNNNLIAVNNSNSVNFTDNSGTNGDNDNSIAANRDAAAARSSHRPSDSSLPIPIPIPASVVALPTPSALQFTRAHTITPISTPSHPPPSSSSSSSSSGSVSNSHKPQQHHHHQQQQQPTYIPIHEDMEGCTWYLFPFPSPSSRSSRFSGDSSTSNITQPFTTTTTTTTPITNGKDGHRLVGHQDTTTNRSQPFSSPSSCTSSASAISPFLVIENSKKELFSLLDTSTTTSTAAASPIFPGEDSLLQCRRRRRLEDGQQEQPEQQNYRQERGGGQCMRRSTTTIDESDEEEGDCSRGHTLLQGLGHASLPDNDTDNEGYAAEPEGQGRVERRGKECQTRTTKLGGISEGQSTSLVGSRSRTTERGSTTTQTIPTSNCTSNTAMNTLFVTIPNIDRPQRHENEDDEEQRRLYDKKMSSNDIDTPLTLLSLSPPQSNNHRFERAPFASRPSPLSHNSSPFSVPTSSFPSFSSSPSSSSLSSLSPSSSSSSSSSLILSLTTTRIPTSTHPLPTTVPSSTQLPLSTGSAPTPPSTTTPTNDPVQSSTNNSHITPTTLISSRTDTHSKMMIMTPPSSANSHAHSHTHNHASQQQRTAATTACTVECWTTMIHLQEQLKQLAQSLVSVLDSHSTHVFSQSGGGRGGGLDHEYQEASRRKHELRSMAMSALETCAGISSTPLSISTTATTATAMTTSTPRSSQHSNKSTHNDSHDDDENDGSRGGNNMSRYGLFTPEATPVSTPVITAVIHQHHPEQQLISPRGSLHSVSTTSSSKMFTCSDGHSDGHSSGTGSGSSGITGLSALTLPGTIISDLEQQQRQFQEHQQEEEEEEEEESARNNTCDDANNGNCGNYNNDPQLLQGTVSHLSNYRLSLPPLSNSSTSSSFPSPSPTAAAANTPTLTGTPTTRNARALQTMPPLSTTTTTVRPTSGKKSKNPFLAMFGKSSSSSPTSPSQGPVRLGGVSEIYSQHLPSSNAHKNSSSSSSNSNGSRSGRNEMDEMKKRGDEESSEKKKRRTSWFKSATTTSTAVVKTTNSRGRANTMFAAFPSSSSGSHAEGQDTRRINNNYHRGSTSPASTATVAATSGPESLGSRVPTTVTLPPGGTVTARRFTTPFQFNLRGSGTHRSTLPSLPTVNNTSNIQAPPPPLPSSSLSSSSSPRQDSPLTSSVPRPLHAQSTGSQDQHQHQHQQYYYYSAASTHPRQLGPSSRTATGSFFDSVSDDDSDSDEGSLSQAQCQQRQQYQYQYQAQVPPPQYYQQVRPQQLQPLQQQQNAAESSSRQYEQDRRYRSYDSDEDSDSSEEEEEEDSENDSEDSEDSDEEEDPDDEEERLSPRHRNHRRYQQQQQVVAVNPGMIEGHVPRFEDEDAPPPPSYHSLIRAEADAARSAALATLSSRGRQGQLHADMHAHAPHTHNHIPPAAVYPHSTSAMRPATLLTGLYQQTTSTLSSSSSSSSLITPTRAPTSRSAATRSTQHQVSAQVLASLLNLLHTFESHLLNHHKTSSFQQQSRQAWLDRNPQTVASFAYLLIELQQSGILPTAMHPSWLSSSSSSSPSALETMMSEQDWLSMTGNAATEADLAKALLALEQNCVLGMDPVLWRQQGEEGEGGRGAWIRQVQAIHTSTLN